MKMQGLLGALALCCLLTLPAAVPVLADDSPFSEPILVLGPEAGPGIFRGPHLLGEDLATIRVGSSLWRTDATPEGTFDLTPPGVGFERVVVRPGKYQWLVGFEGTFPGPGLERSLWRTDGTVAGTVLLRERLVLSLGNATGFHRERGLFFFTAAAGEETTGHQADFEPWVSDGTPQGTRRLKDLVPDGASTPLFYTELGKDMLFLARDPDNPLGRALWRSDGTAQGTRRIFHPGSEGFTWLWVVGSTVFLEATTGSADPGRSFWRSDGTPEGTVRLRRFEDASFFSFSGELDEGRSTWSVVRDGLPGSLWVTDGTEEGTRELMPLAPSFWLIPPFAFHRYRGAFYFGADDGLHGNELWRTDGTPDGTGVAFETCQGACSDFAGLHNRQPGEPLLAWIDDPEHGIELHATDGTVEGTTLLLDLCPGPCSPNTFRWHDLGGLYVFSMRANPTEPHQLWATDLTPEGTRQLTEVPGGSGSTDFLTELVNGRLLFGGASYVWALPIAPFDPPPPPGGWLASPAVPDFSFKVRISSGGGSILGAQEPGCIPETLCVSGAVPGRSEVFLRVIGPRPNGRMWPTLVKFSTSTVEVWVRQDSSGEVRYYLLEGARPGFDELPGLFDRVGFAPAAAGVSAVSAAQALTLAEPIVLAGGAAPASDGAVFTSEHFPDFRFRARITAGGQVQEVRKEAACIEETLCLSGALPGRSEVFLRIIGPRPNGRLWPMIVKLTTSTLEVWIEQISTGETKHYRIEGAAPGKDDLTGLFDRVGFAP